MAGTRKDGRHSFDTESAREAGIRSAEERKRRAELAASDPEAYLRDTFSAKKEQLTQALLDAALGQGVFHDLDPGKRLQALTKALEYAVGKPTAQTKQPDQTQPEQGLSIE